MFLLKMMPKPWVLAAAAAMVAVVPAAHAEEAKPSEWHYSKSIELQGQGPYHALFLDEEVYAGAKEDLSDIRIVDDQGQFVPYYRNSGYGNASETTVSYASRLTATAKKNQDTAFDYAVTPLEDHTDIKGGILSFTLPKQPFLKHVEVYGSNDGNQWQLVTKDVLYFTGQQSKNTIDLEGEYKFDHYRLAVLGNVESPPFPDMMLLDRSREMQWNDFVRTADLPYEIKEENGATQVTVHNRDRLKIRKLQLDAEGSFVRTYSVDDAESRALAVEGKTELYRLDFQDAKVSDTSITAAVPFSAPDITIRIDNEDNPPLNITGLHTEYFLDQLVFEAKAERSYRLLYGNGNAAQPRYDIEAFKTHIEKDQPTVVKLGAQVAAPNSASGQAPAVKWYQSKTGFNIVIIAVSLLLMILLLAKLKKVGRDG